MKLIVPRILATFVLIATLFLCCPGANAQRRSVYVHGYFRSNGTYVSPHFRSAPDGNFFNNWSTAGNINPYTGMMGTRTYPTYPAYRIYTPLYPAYRPYQPYYPAYH